MELAGMDFHPSPLLRTSGVDKGAAPERACSPRFRALFVLTSCSCAGSDFSLFSHLKQIDCNKSTCYSSSSLQPSQGLIAACIYWASAEEFQCGTSAPAFVWVNSTSPLSAHARSTHSLMTRSGAKQSMFPLHCSYERQPRLKDMRKSQEHCNKVIWSSR